MELRETLSDNKKRVKRLTKSFGFHKQNSISIKNTRMFTSKITTNQSKRNERAVKKKF